MGLPTNKLRRNTTNQPAPEPVDPDTHSGLADAYRMSWMGQLWDEFEELDAPPPTPGFDFRDHVPEGYEQYADAFAKAESLGQLELIKRNIDENIALRARRDERSGLSTFTSDAVAAIVDPTSLLGAPLKGVGIVAGTTRGVLAIGGVGAATELARGMMDETATREEIAWGVGLNLATGGVLGGAVGSFGKGAKPATLPLPVQGRVTSGFGRRRAPTRGASTEHLAVDIAAPRGTPVQAPKEGKVVMAAPTKGGGNTVKVDHGGGMVTTYMHLDSIGVRVGDTLRRGQRLGTVGMTGTATGYHLHYRVEVDGKPVDPLKHADTDAEVRPPDDPTATPLVLSGIEVPDRIELEGRGVKIVVGSTGRTTPDGLAVPATFKRAKAADDIVAEEIAAVSRAAPDDPPATIRKTVNRYDAKGRKIGEYEVDLPANIVNRPAREAVLPSKDAPSYDPAKVEALARRLDIRADALEEAGGDEATVAALRQRAQDVRDELTFADGHFVPGVDGVEGFVLAADRRRFASEQLDEGIAELRAQDREAYGRAMDDGTIADDLPFGLGRVGEAAAEDGDHIVIDVDALLGSFGQKPWTRPTMAGVDAFPEDAFTQPWEWVEFVKNHEVFHTVTARMEGESAAAYENRINKLAYERLIAGKADFRPSNSRLERLAIAPTPMGQLMRLVPDAGAEIHQSMQDLAGDFGVQLARNVIGGPSTPGGSVMQRALRWQGQLQPVRDAIRRAYVKHIGGAPDGSRLQVEGQTLAQRIPFVGAKARGKPTIAQFRAEVTRAIVGGAEVSPEAAAAAAKFTAVMRNVSQAMADVGLGQYTKGLLKRAERLENRASFIQRRIDQLRETPTANELEQLDELLSLPDRMREQAAKLRADAETPVMPRGEEAYFPRHWNVRAAVDGKDRLLDILRTGYAREGHPNPDAAAKGAFDTITMDPSGEFSAPGSPSSLRHRSIPVTNAEVFDFIVQDPEMVMAVYLRRVGAAIEMTRRYGDSFGLDEIDAMRADMALRGVPRDQAEKALQLWEDARDRIVGGFHGKNPMSWDNRAVRALKNLTNLAVMGGVLRSQISDIAHLIGVQGLGTKRMLTGEGPAGLIGGMYAAVVGDISRFSPGGLAKQAGEAMELVSARVTAHMIEADDAYLVTAARAPERWLAAAQSPFFTLNGMAPFTVMMKELAGVIAGHNLVDDARKVAEAIRAGGAAPAKESKRLASYGIDAIDAQIIADMPTEQGASGLHLLNIEAWEGDRGARARELVLAAVNGEVRRAIVTPGPLDRPAIMDGVFHSKKGREEALQAVADAQAKVDEAKGMLGQLRGRPDDDPAKVEAVEALQRATGEWNMARRNVGVRGRKEAPIASLPFQMHSFAVAAGGKVLHGLLSGRERSRFAMIASLLAAGGIATWLKASDGQWENMSWEEFALSAFNNSSVGAWFTDIGQAAWRAVDGPLGMESEWDAGRVSDEVGAVGGAGPGIIARLIEPFVSDDGTHSDQVRAVRQTLPFNNLIWMKSVVDRIEDAIQGDEERGALSAEPVDASSEPLPVTPIAPAPVDDSHLVRDLPEMPALDQLPKPKKKAKGRRPRSVKPALL